ncbi:MAG: alpha/beta fold hydrolase [Acidobacteriaceae bacterium]|jgi:pimeloyl-ACP methyl ester carboxylesterase
MRFISRLLMLIALSAVIVAPRCVAQSQLAGDWQGTLKIGGSSLRLVFHITGSQDKLTATIDSLDQGAKGIPTTSVTVSGDLLTISATSIGGEFKGKVSTDGNTIDGTWTQGGSIPLVLGRIRGQASLAPARRPQNPIKPYPYREENVSYINATSGNRIAGTLTLPPGKGRFPAVLLIVGSGPHDRDESVMGHKPFLVLADYLTRKGVVVLRSDKRGVGGSAGDLASATTADFATDAEAGVAFLKARSEVNPRKIGLIGHSEGGVVAPMVAARDHAVAFIVMMAGPGVPGDQITVNQTLLLSKAAGLSEEVAEKNAELERSLLALVVTEKDNAVLENDLRQKLAGTGPPAQINAQIKALTSPWYRYFLTYDPAIALRKVTCPVLAINGGKDLQVPPTLNLPAIRKALKEGGNKNFEVDELPGLNHLFQTANTGSPDEYAGIEETISPVALDKIASWIHKR